MNSPPTKSDKGTVLHFETLYPKAAYEHSLYPWSEKQKIIKDILGNGRNYMWDGNIKLMSYFFGIIMIFHLGE
jgi:hypothetical protein